MPRSRSSPRQKQLQACLIEARRASGMSQTELATQLKRPQSFVSKFESGERRIDVVEFIEVCEALQIEAAELLRQLMASPTQ